MPDEPPGRRALAAIDRVLAGRPHKDDPDLSQAAEGLAAMRDELVARLRRGEGGTDLRERLGRLNAVISLVLANHFPLGATPWDELGKARDTLAGLLATPVSQDGSTQTQA